MALLAATEQRMCSIADVIATPMFTSRRAAGVGHVTTQVHIVVQMTSVFGSHSGTCTSRVLDELPFAHLVLHLRTAQVHLHTETQ